MHTYKSYYQPDDSFMRQSEIIKLILKLIFHVFYIGGLSFGLQRAVKCSRVKNKHVVNVILAFKMSALPKLTVEKTKDWNKTELTFCEASNNFGKIIA